MKNKYFKYFLLAPSLILMLAITIYPLFRSFWISLHAWDLKESIDIGPFIGFENYVRAFTDYQFVNSLIVTLIFTAGTVICTIVLSIFVAIILSKEKKHLAVIRSILIIPFAISPAMIGYSWRFMFNPDYGLFDTIIGFFIPALSNVVWLAHPSTAMIALISVVVWIFLPFISLMFISGLMGMPQEVYEAARIDGASSSNILFKITLPMLKPVILIGTILTTMFALRTFDPIVTLTQGGPGNSTTVLNFMIYKTGFRFFNMGYSAALGYILGAITFLIIIVYMRRLVKGDQWN